MTLVDQRMMNNDEIEDDQRMNYDEIYYTGLFIQAK